MRNKINATNTINERYVECHVASIISMCLDYATSFTVYRHNNCTHIDFAHEWVGCDNYRSYSITVYKDGVVQIRETTDELGERKDFDDYESAMETIFNAIVYSDFDTFG